MTNFGPGYLNEAQLRAIPFRSVGKDVLINERANLVHVENISIGDNVRIDAMTILATGSIVIGSHVHIGEQSYFAGRGGIELQDFTNVSQGVKLYSTSDDYSGRTLTNPTIPSKFLGVHCSKITLRRHVIVGSGSIVLPGVTLEEGCAVGALSLVVASTEPWSIYAGLPARKIKDRRRDLLALEQQFLAEFASC